MRSWLFRYFHADVGGDVGTFGGFAGGAVTNPLLVPDGSPTAPGMAFSAQSGTGWYRTAAPDVRLAIAGSYVYLFSATQFLPTSTGANDIGSAGFAWKQAFFDFTNTGTVGAVTINKTSGRVNIAAAGSSVVVTNSLSAAASRCFANLAGAQDATARSAQCDCSTPGQITIRLNAAATAQVAIDFMLFP